MNVILRVLFDSVIEGGLTSLLAGMLWQGLFSLLVGNPTGLGKWIGTSQVCYRDEKSAILFVFYPLALTHLQGGARVELSLTVYRALVFHFKHFAISPSVVLFNSPTLTSYSPTLSPTN